jgi:intraflagellar transport protein 88
LNVISWLGAYYVNLENYDQAITYLQRATLIEPNEVEWNLMVASCQRRVGNYQIAFATYKSIHSKYPENSECNLLLIIGLRFLVRMCQDLGDPAGKEYTKKLSKLEEDLEPLDDHLALMNGTGVSDPLPPSFLKIRPISSFSNATKDLFQEDALDYLPE